MTDKPQSLVALRDRREAAIQQLTDAYAHDVISVEEFEDRVARAHAAVAVAELDTLVADLAPPPPPALVPRAVALIPSGKKKLRSLFSSLERRGAWSVPDQLSVSATFGNVELDFREARWSSAITTIDARCVFGNLEIIVPPELAVECDGNAVFGNIEHHHGSGVAEPDRPMLRIKGTVVFGNIEVHVRLPGESEHDTRKRLESERRAQLALPAPK